MPDVSAKIKGLNVEFNDNLTTSPNIDSGDDIKTSFARIHKRFSDMKTGAYEDIADQYYPSGEGSEKLVTGEIVQSAIESVSGDIDYIEYAIKNLSREIYNNVEMPITTGYYISGITEGDDWTQHLDADSSSQYLENAFYLGARQINKKLKFTVADHRYTSGRCFGFCDENNIVTSYYKENWDIWEQNADGTYTATLPISGPYFFLSYSDNEIIGFEISEELINQTGYVSPNGSDSNGGSSFDFAFKTVNKALSEGCTRIILDGGAYYQQIDLSPAHGKHIDIISYDREYRPVFYDPNCILAESATLSDGVYSTTIDQTISSGNWWLYQEGIPDIETQIAESERLPVQRGKTYRLDDTRIEKCYADNLTDALAEIKSSSIYKWYLDSNTLYFTAPTQPSQTNPICFSSGNDLFSGADRSISIRMSGIQCKYISLNLKNLCNAEAIDCCVTNIFGWGAITWDNTLNAYFLRCEASSCKNDTNGDGFNADVTNTGEAFSKHYTSTLIDCWSHDNTDDGYSDHRHAESTIIGGLFEYNGKAGLTPVYGAHCSCYNVYSRKNYTGFMCTGDVEEAEGGKFTQMICYNCVAELNNRAGNETGFYVDGLNNRMTLISCKAIGNPTAYYVGETASIKLVDCTAFDNNRFIHGYPENATIENTGLYRYLQQYSDLNDFTGNNNVGSYLCPNSRVFTITNKPESITTAFKMDITFYNDQTMQMIYPNDNSCVFYVRIYNNSSWSDWIKSSNEINTTSPITKSSSGQDITIGHATSGITAGTYKSVTVNETGHITSGSNPSTISGYGITDAKIQNGTITLGSNTITPVTSFSSLDSPAVGGSGKYISSISETDGIISATETTLDTVPTANSTNAITSGAVYTDSANQQLEIDYAINTGAKNLLNNQYLNMASGIGVTITDNGDGTYNLSGTPTGTATYLYTTSANFSSLYGLKVGGTYTITTGSNNVLIRIDYSTDGTSWNSNPLVNNVAGQATFTIPPLTTGLYIRFRSTASAGSLNGVVLKPMIRRAEITDDTFQPYAPTNRELYETKTEQTETNVIANLGAKNLLPIRNNSGTSNGVTFTVMEDGQIVANGTATNGDANYYGHDVTVDGTYRVSGCPSGGNFATGYSCYWSGANVSETGSGASFTRTGTVTFRIIIRNGTTVNNLAFKPMLRYAEITDDTFQPYAPTNRELYETKTEKTETNVIANAGAKNLFPNTATSQTIGGVTFTVHDDGTVTANGTKTNNDWFILSENNSFDANTYTLSDGLPDDTIGCRLIISTALSMSAIKMSTETNLRTQTKTFTTAQTGLYYAIRIASGATVNNLTFKPMIRPATITDATYEPYAMTNVELTENTVSMHDEVDYAINTGSKNFLKITASSQTIKGVTFTVNDDQTVTVNGTNDGTGASTFVIVPNAQAITIPDGNYILSGCPTGGGGSVPFDLRWYMYSPGKSAYESGNGASVKKSGNGTGSNIAIVVKTGQIANNLVFKPMLRRAEITDDTFQPYAPTNRELYETKTEQTETNVIANLGAKNMLYISNAPGYTTTSHGRTFTVLSDGGIKITGASSDSSNADFYVIGSWGNRSILLNENQDSCLIRMECDTNYGYNQIRLRAMNRSTGSTVSETGVETNKDVKLSHVITTVFISVFPSVTLPEDGIIVYPMLRRAEITDATYEPYAPTNRELYETCETKVTMQQAYGDATAIPANSDLNNYITPGIYYALVSNVPTITNTPYTATGLRLVVEKNTLSGTAVFQTLYPTSRSHLEFYRRIYESGIWSSWYRFTGETVVASASTQSLNSPMTLNLSRSDLNESLDTNLESFDTDLEPFNSTQEEESESYNTDEELTEEQSE